MIYISMLKGEISKFVTSSLLPLVTINGNKGLSRIYLMSCELTMNLLAPQTKGKSQTSHLLLPLPKNTTCQVK